MHARRTRIVGKGVDHGFHGLHLLDDRASQSIEGVAVLGFHFTEILVAQAFGGELNGCEWVLDLMGQAPRYLTPGGIALRLNQIGNIIEDDDAAGKKTTGSRQGRAAAGEDLAPARTKKNDLLAPVVAGRAGRTGFHDPRLQGVLEWMQVRMQVADFR